MENDADQNEKKEIRATGTILGDSAIVELLFDRVGRTTSFAICRNGQISIENKV